MSKRLNYKNFKKIHEDANSATLQHPEGHTIKIAKGPLSDHIKKQLGALAFADGGEVKRDLTGNRIDEQNPEEDASKYNPSYKPTPEKPHAVPVHSEEVTGAIKRGFQHFANGGMSMPDGTEVQPSEEQPVPDMTSQMASMQLPPPEAPAQPSNPVIPQPQSAPAQPPMANYPEQAMVQAQSGVANQAKAEGALGKEEANIAQQNTHRMQELDVIHQAKQRNLTNEIDNVINEVKSQKIDPNHFWNERSSLGKVSTAIGLILGGMSAGLTGGPNPALQFLNQQIDRDVEGQRMEMSKKMNALSALQHQFGNNIDATNMLKAMQAGVYASQLTEAAAKSKDPMAMARAQQANAQILATYGPMVQQTALRQTVLQGIQSGHVQPAEAVNVLVPEKDRHLAYEEVKQAENQQRGLQNLKATMDKVAQLQSYGNRIANPIQSKSQIAALNTQIAGHVKEIFGKTSDTELEILKHNEIGVNDDAKTIALKTKNILDLASKEQSHPVLDANHIKLPKVIVNKFNPR